ncbi:hypothetical protein GB937_010721, partial [Aspergillus fischeri]
MGKSKKKDLDTPTSVVDDQISNQIRNALLGTIIIDVRLYTAVLWPQIAYACSTWYIRGGFGFKGAETAVRKAMESIQHQALYRIAGAFRTTARAALEVCLDVPPAMLNLARTAEEACARLMTSPLRRELHAIRSLGRRPAGSRYADPDRDPLTSPLERLERRLRGQLGVSPTDIETIEPFVVSPWWQPPDIAIAETREQALGEHRKVLAGVCGPSTIIAYTDGSGTDKGVGAAVVSPLGSRACRLGSLDSHTVYAAELCGVEMALHLTARAESPVTQFLNPQRERQITIFTDNQAAIRASAEPKGSSGQFYIRQIVRLLDHLRADGWRVRLQWLPGHEGVYGNERADRLAKDAAEGDGEPAGPVLYASLRRRLQASMREHWHRFWANHAHGAALRRIFTAPSRAVLQLHVGLKRAASSVVIQMQTGKIALASYLGLFGAMPTVDCTCGLGRQDVQHILITCPTYA